MAYSVMVWLVDPGEQAHQREAMRRTTTGRSQAPGAASGVNEPPAFTRSSPLVSGVPHDPQKRFLGGFSWRHRGHGTCRSVMVCLSYFPCPNIFSLYTSL